MRNPTKKFCDWVIKLVITMASLYEMDSKLNLFKGLPGGDLVAIHWVIFALTVIATLWFLWRGIDGFFLKMDFVFDENHPRW
jgi:hypothetical protein